MMKRERIRDITFVALCVAIMAVVSQLAIPFGPVPFTLQAFAVSLIGYFLGLKRGLAAVAVYIAVGAVGVPVFAGFNGGFGALISYTGGFIFGYLPFVCLCALGKAGWQKICFGSCGLLLCHLAGVIQYMLLSSLSLWVSFFTVSLPFLLKDIILVIGAYFVSKALNKRLKNTA